MEGVSVSAYKRLKNYWHSKRRGGYQRLGEPSDPARPRPKRSWRVKRIRIFTRIGSPRRWLTRLRDAYVSLMLKVGNSSLVTTGFGGSVDYYGPGFGRAPAKEYDENVIAQIHKALAMAQAQGGIVPRVAPEHGPPLPSHALPAR